VPLTPTGLLLQKHLALLHRLARQPEHARRLDEGIFPRIQGGPLMHIIAAKAVAFKEAMSSEFRAYQQQTVANARILGEALERVGFRLVSGGTDNHLLLLDLTPQGITGRWAEEALERLGITVNRNAIPFDPRPPRVASGIRLGTPTLTARGMREGEMAEVAQLIHDLRTQAGLSQKELADAIGTTQSVISRLEDADYSGHSLTMLNRIAGALNQRLTVTMTPMEKGNGLTAGLTASRSGSANDGCNNAP
jgi:glycine/serine hydroxymethyltransferase